ETHVIVEMKRPGLAVGRDLPRVGEPRLDVGRARLPADEALEDELADLDRLGVGDADRIERDDVGRLGDDERARIATPVQRLATRVAAESERSDGERADPHNVPHCTTPGLIDSPLSLT